MTNYNFNNFNLYFNFSDVKTNEEVVLKVKNVQMEKLGEALKKLVENEYVHRFVHLPVLVIESEVHYFRGADQYVDIVSLDFQMHFSTFEQYDPDYYPIEERFLKREDIDNLVKILLPSATRDISSSLLVRNLEDCIIAWYQDSRWFSIHGYNWKGERIYTLQNTGARNINAPVIEVDATTD